jgi:hypothetical protein
MASPFVKPVFAKRGFDDREHDDAGQGKAIFVSKTGSSTTTPAAMPADPQVSKTEGAIDQLFACARRF